MTIGCRKPLAQLAVVAMGIGLMGGLASLASADTRRMTTPSHLKKAPEPVAPVVVGPPPAMVIPPERLDLHPAVPPQVVFNNGMLTVTAQNSTLGDILNAVRLKTGATVEMNGAAPDRVAIHVGPATPREVLTALLEGGRFNYIILGTAADPEGADHIILTPKTSGTANGPLSAAQQPSPPTQAPAPSPFPQQGPRLPFVPGATPPVGQAADAETADAPDATQDAEAEAEQAAEPEPEEPVDDPNQPNRNPQGQKSPEEQLRELQQQQQQQNPQPPQGPR